MARQALKKETYSEETPIDAPRQVQSMAEREEGEIIRPNAKQVDNDYAERLKFMEDPVTIRIEPSSEENAPEYLLLAVNGRGCEYLVNGKWKTAVHGWIKIGEVITIKRKYLEVLARSKINKIETVIPENGSSDGDWRQGGTVKKFTRQMHSFSVLKDENPKGAEWLTGIIRRNL